MGPEDLDFPVLCLSRDSSVVVAADREALCRCSALALWGNEYYRDLRVFDASATPYSVVAAEPERRFSAVGRLLARLSNREFAVRLRLQQLGPSSVEVAKAHASEWLDRAPEFWEASDDLDVWKRRISSCTTMIELIELFT